MQSNIRIIELLRFLYQQTDEAHAVTVSEMIEHLKGKGIPSVRQTVYTDLEALDTAGIDIVQIKSTQNRYFIGSRIFEYPELKMLVDAVASSKVISAKKSQALIQKLGQLSSIQQAEQLQRLASLSSRVKPHNEKVYYIIDSIQTAMRMENGLFVPPSVPYGYRLAGRDLEIVPEEAEVVRRIFSAYLSGQGKDDIAKELNQLGVDRGRNREKWYPSTVAYILTNISYTGNMIWQKSYATDTIPFQQVRNRGQKPRYFVEHSHPAIVSSEDFQRVQKLMSFRNGQFRGTVRQRRETLYSKRIYCGECGSLCRKKVTGGKTYWVCRRHDSDKADCPIPQIPELEITAAVLRLYHKLKLGLETVLRPVLTQLQELRERELRSNRKISDIDNEIARISEQNLVLVRLKSKGYVDSALYLSQMDEIEHKLRELRKLRRRLLETAGEDRQIQETERMLEYLTDSPEWLDEVTSDLFRELIERITIISPTRLKFRLLNGLELSESIERMIR